MLTSVDRMMIYAVLCLISFSSIMLTSHHTMGFFAVGGLFSAAIGLWLELTNKADLEEK